MKKLKLPIIKVPRYEPKPLSMDEYLEFVLFNLKTAYKKTKAEWNKRNKPVNVPFSLK